MARPWVAVTVTTHVPGLSGSVALNEPSPPALSRVNLVGIGWSCAVPFGSVEPGSESVAAITTDAPGASRWTESGSLVARFPSRA